MTNISLSERSNVIELGSFKRKESTINKNTLSTQKTSQNPQADMTVRINNIKQSIQRINHLMSELNDISKNPYSR